MRILAKIGMLLTGLIVSVNVTNAQSAKFGLIGGFGSNDLVFYPDRHNYEVKPIFHVMGFSFQYHLKESVFVKTGALFTNTAYDLIYLHNPQDPNDPSIPVRSEITNYYIDMPLVLGYDFISSERIRLSSNIGAIIALPLTQHQQFIYEDDSSVLHKSKDVLVSHLSAHLSLGVTYNLKKNISLSLEPYLKYGLEDVVDSHILYQNAFGVLLGTHYAF